MSHKKQFSWMIRPKGFIKLIGAEYELMRKAGGKVLLAFYFSSVIILAIAVATCFSVWHAMELLFHSVLVEVLMSVFMSSLFVLLYVFLINTFTKDEKKRRFLNLSNTTRFGFLMFMGFIISKPIEIYFLQQYLDQDVIVFRQQLKASHEEKINGLLDDDVANLMKRKESIEKLNANRIFDTEIAQIMMSVQLLEQKRSSLISRSAREINAGDYFTYRIQKASTKYPWSWLICAGVVIVFLLPGILVYSISGQNNYFQLKKAQEHRMIENAYRAFVEKYHSMFKKYEKDVWFYTKYEDPPFNTRLKAEPSYQSSQDFHRRFAV